MDFQQARRLFPVTSHQAYLNNASVAPVPVPVAEAVAELYASYGREGGDRGAEWFHRVDQVRSRLARLVGARGPEEIWFARNTSEGLICAIHGFPWRAGDNAVTLSGEFPSVTVPLRLLSERRGIGLRLVAPRPDRTFALEDVAAAFDARTRMLVASFVEFHTGCRNDLAALGKLCRERGVFFAVDGVQGVGALTTRAADWGVDLLAAAGHKWLTSGEGTGFGWVRQERIAGLDPPAGSWLSLEEPLDFLTGRADTARFDKPLRADARRFEGGTLNVPGIIALGRSVELMLELGPEAIERRVLELASLAAEGVARKGYLVLSPRAPEFRSGLTVFTAPDPAVNRRLQVELRRQGVTLGLPCGMLRASPHYYNDESDIARLLEALPAVKP